MKPVANSTQRERSVRVSLESHLVMETMVGEEMQVVLAERDMMVESIVKAKRDVLTVRVLLMEVMVRVRRIAGVESHKMMEEIRRFTWMEPEMKLVANSTQRERTARSSLKTHLVMESMAGEVVLAERDTRVENAVKTKRVVLTVGVLLAVVGVRVRKVVEVETHKMMEDIGSCILVVQG